MASYDIAAVRSGITSILNGVSSLMRVYNYPSPNIDGYPAAVFELDNEEGTLLDDVNNQRVLTFKIWVITDVGVETLSAASSLLDGVTKDIINALEKISNQTLSGAADWTMPVIGQRQQVGSTSGVYLYQELNLKVYIASSIL